MSKIACHIVRDLLPLYADDVLSEQTAQTVTAHLAECDDCKQEHDALTRALRIPTAPDVQTENSRVLRRFKRRWNCKAIMIACVSVLVTCLLVVVGCLVVQNVSTVNSFFFPAIHTRVFGEGDGEWITVEEYYDSTEFVGDALVFDSLFDQKEVINDANNEADIILRVRDENGHIVVDEMAIPSGEARPLDELERGKAYTVELKTDAESIILNFR